jgi:hypothetical protein
MTTFVYVHSGDRVPGGTPAKFQVTLPQPLVLDSRCKLRVDNVRIPNTYMTIDERNCFIYWSNSVGADHASQIPVGYYTATQLGTALTNAMGMGGSIYDATRNSLQLDFALATTFYTDAQLASKPSSLFGLGASAQNPCSCNGILKNDGGNQSTYLNGGSSYRINFLSVSPYDYVFLRSQRLASQNAISVRGEHDVLAMVPINGAFGDILTGGTPLNEALDIDATTINQMDFTVSDRYGIPVNQQAEISFQLTFFQ